MDLFVVMVEDRHTDPAAFPFADRDQAIAAARAYFQAEFDAEEFGDDPELGEQDVDGGPWLYHAELNHEGDSVWVVRRSLDGPVDLD